MVLAQVSGLHLGRDRFPFVGSYYGRLGVNGARLGSRRVVK
jgi:hypothetical protein